MAIARGAGTEIIRSATFADVDSTLQVLIQGEQHHIYTVLSVSVYIEDLQAATNSFYLILKGYNSKGGTTAVNQKILNWKPLVVAKTFVWNDKFSFNGYEPVDFTGPMDDATKQNAIADQGSSVAQYLYAQFTHASDGATIHISYIDQNNA